MSINDDRFFLVMNAMFDVLKHMLQNVPVYILPVFRMFFTCHTLMFLGVEENQVYRRK
jgi:hypothetical protein